MSSADLVNRDFMRSQPHLLWVCDITEHPTREGKVYGCAILDAFSRKIAGWSMTTPRPARAFLATRPSMRTDETTTVAETTQLRQHPPRTVDTSRAG